MSTRGRWSGTVRVQRLVGLEDDLRNSIIHEEDEEGWHASGSNIANNGAIAGLLLGESVSPPSASTEQQPALGVGPTSELSNSPDELPRRPSPELQGVGSTEPPSQGNADGEEGEGAQPSSGGVSVEPEPDGAPLSAPVNILLQRAGRSRSVAYSAASNAVPQRRNGWRAGESSQEGEFEIREPSRMRRRSADGVSVGGSIRGSGDDSVRAPQKRAGAPKGPLRQVDDTLLASCIAQRPKTNQLLQQLMGKREPAASKSKLPLAGGAQQPTSTSTNTSARPSAEQGDPAAQLSPTAPPTATETAAARAAAAPPQPSPSSPTTPTSTTVQAPSPRAGLGLAGLSNARGSQTTCSPQERDSNGSFAACPQQYTLVYECTVRPIRDPQTQQ